eukprot:1198094-Karenia_brevis.AAC.1
MRKTQPTNKDVSNILARTDGCFQKYLRRTSTTWMDIIFKVSSSLCSTEKTFSPNIQGASGGKKTYPAAFWISGQSPDHKMQ